MCRNAGMYLRAGMAMGAAKLVCGQRYEATTWPFFCKAGNYTFITTGAPETMVEMVLIGKAYMITS